MDPQVNPFAVLSLIVAPAVLTNASSVLVMSTSNRLARAVDRARELSKQLEEAGDLTSSEAVRRLRELAATEQRSLMLLVALRSFYVALGSFASAALVSLLGAVLAPLSAGGPVRVLEVGGVVAGLLAVSALVHGSVVLVRETRLVVQVLQERAVPQSHPTPSPWPTSDGFQQLRRPHLGVAMPLLRYTKNVRYLDSAPVSPCCQHIIRGVYASCGVYPIPDCDVGQAFTLLPDVQSGTDGLAGPCAYNAPYCLIRFLPLGPSPPLQPSPRGRREHTTGGQADGVHDHLW